MSDLREYINKLRHDFSKGHLDEKDVDKNPLLQFEKWFREAVEAKANEPNAMVLSTVDAENKPGSRVVLLRNFSDSGFVFYSNYLSRKAIDLEKNPNACLNFFWPELERQVRINGKLKRQSAKESDEYFNARPRESKIGAWISKQSTILKNRKDLEDAFEAFQKKYDGKEIPRPEHWGGYVLMPNNIEFWQGRLNRLHDRIRYILENNSWKIERLYP